MIYKLICIDMDGTLLNSNHEVSEENKSAIKKATEAGVKIAITTGRIFCSARYYSKILGVSTPVIASNGAYIREQDSEDIIFSNTIPSSLLVKVYEIVEKYNLNINFNTSDTVLSPKELPSHHTYKIMNGNLEEEDKVKFFVYNNIDDVVEGFDGAILKGIVIEEVDFDALSKAKEELLKTLGQELHIVSSHKNNIEIMLHSSTKGYAVEMLAQKYNFKAEEVICIGDSENDISMLKYAGMGVAMGNALDEVKAIADYVTDSNENSGVGKAIMKLLNL